MKELIRNGSAAEVTATLFAQRLKGGKEVVYFTAVLSPEEEIELVHRLVSDENQEEWVHLMSEYRKHYPLCNEAVDLLIKNSEDEGVIKVLSGEFRRYSYTEEQAVKICNKIRASGPNKQQHPLLIAISSYGRIFYDKVFNLLVNIDKQSENDNGEKTNYAESYRKAIKKHRLENNLERFHEQKTPA